MDIHGSFHLNYNYLHSICIYIYILMMIQTHRGTRVIRFGHIDWSYQRSKDAFIIPDTVITERKRKRCNVRNTHNRSIFVMYASRVSPPDAVMAVSSSQAEDKKRLAIFVSGGGSNFRAIHAGILDGRIHANVAVVVTNAPSCKGAEYAKSHGIPVVVHPIPKKDFDGPEEQLDAEQLLAALCDKFEVDYIVLAGYMKLIPSKIVQKYHRAIINIHPGLLPSFGGKGFYGQRVHEAVIACGARLSGPTIHFVDEEYDTGPILAQSAVPVYPNDTPQTLAARVLQEEHKLYPECVAALCDGRVTWREDGIPIIWNPK